MRVEHFLGSTNVTKEGELDAVLAQRGENGSNEFWMGDARDPEMTIMLSEDDVCVHYFPGNGHPGFRSVPAATTDVALAAAKAFFRNPERLPRALSWFEL